MKVPLRDAPVLACLVGMATRTGDYVQTAVREKERAMKLGRIVIDCPEYFREELAWATAHEDPAVLDEFMECLSYLLQYGSRDSEEVRLRKDFAPHSFTASVMRRKIVERPNQASGDWWWVEQITMGMIWSDHTHDGKHWSFHS